MFRPWRSFPFMVAAGLVVGLATGGFPAALSKSVQQLALVLAMTFSLTEISFRGVSARAQARGLVLAFAMSYVLLGGLLLAYALASPDPEIRSGWVLMAAVPPAVAVVPVTSTLRGDTRGALISDAVLYVSGLVAVPTLALAFIGESVPVGELVVQTLLLIGLPILASRPLRAWRGLGRSRSLIVNVCFFLLVLAIAGSTRDQLLGRQDLLPGLSILAFARTFGLGLAVFAAAAVLRMPRDGRIMASTFVGFKNLGLTVVLAFSVFGALASVPALVALIFETLWMGVLPLLYRQRASPPPDLEGHRASTREPK